MERFNKKVRWFSRICVIVFILIPIYLIVSLVQGEFNPQRWSLTLQIVYFLLFLWNVGYIIMRYKDDVKENARQKSLKDREENYGRE